VKGQTRKLVLYETTPELMMGRRGRSYEESLLKRLGEHEYAVEYLNAVLAGDGPDSTGTFLAALRLVAKAQLARGLGEALDLQ